MRLAAPPLLLLGLLVTGACGVADTEAQLAAPPVSSEVSSGQVEVVGVHTDVDYYGACGNETLTVDGITYYPMYYDDVQALDTTRYPVLAAEPVHGFGGGVVRVAAPGPGDDIGTLIAYADGIARYESHSGRVLWLTTAEQTYAWVC